MKNTNEIIAAAKITKKEKGIALKFGAKALFEGVTIAPVYYQGSGRWSSIYDSSTKRKEIEELKAIGLFHYETGNDAPRGSATGEFHTFTPKRKRLTLKKILAK